MSDSNRECPQCREPIEGRPNKKFCSDTCKGRYFRENGPSSENSNSSHIYEQSVQSSYTSCPQAHYLSGEIKDQVETTYQKIYRENQERRDREEIERKTQQDKVESIKLHERFCAVIREFLQAEGKQLAAKPVSIFSEQVEKLTEAYRNHPYLKLPGNLVRSRLQQLYHVHDLIQEVTEEIEQAGRHGSGRFEIKNKWRLLLRDLLIAD
jgi:hypothetical protein